MLLDASNQYFVVGYEFTTGEYGIPKQKLITGEEGQTKDEILDDYFGDFFGEGTRKDENRYWSYDDCQVIKITSWQPVPVEDAVIIKKYFMY